MSSTRAFVYYAMVFAVVLILIAFTLPAEEAWSSAGTLASMLGSFVSLWTLSLVFDVKREMLLKVRAGGISRELAQYVAALNKQMDDVASNPAPVQETLGKCYGLLSGLESKLRGEHLGLLRAALASIQANLPRRRWWSRQSAISTDSIMAVYVDLVALDTALRALTKELRVT